MNSSQALSFPSKRVIPRAGALCRPFFYRDDERFISTIGTYKPVMPRLQIPEIVTYASIALPVESGYTPTFPLYFSQLHPDPTG